MKNTIDRYASLDGFRGVCILLVLLHNLYPYDAQDNNPVFFPLHQMALSGWVGVQWFFVLSGFLITRILLTYNSDLKSIKTFYLRRSLRIFPIYYFTLLVILVILPWSGHIFPETTVAVNNQYWFWLYISNWATLFHVNNLGLSHFWSLAVEEQFYIAWPWLILFARRNTVFIVLSALIVSAFFFRIYFDVAIDDSSQQLAYQLTIVRWDALAIGALTAYCLKEKQLIDFLEAKFNYFIGVLFVGFLIAITIQRGFAPVVPGWGMLNQTLAALWGMAIIWLCIKPKYKIFTLIVKLMEVRLLRHLGKYSYAIYILHLIVGVGIPKLLDYSNIDVSEDNPVVAWSITLSTVLSTYVLARLSWTVIESPFLKLKAKLV